MAFLPLSQAARAPWVHPTWLGGPGDGLAYPPLVLAVEQQGVHGRLAAPVAGVPLTLPLLPVGRGDLGLALLDPSIELCGHFIVAHLILLVLRAYLSSSASVPMLLVVSPVLALLPLHLVVVRGDNAGEDRPEVANRCVSHGCTLRGV
jgi:hypothetical protein